MKILSGTKKQGKKQKNDLLAENAPDSGLLVTSNYISHMPLCLSEKMRHCFKSSNIFEKTSDFFHALAVTDSTTLESGVKKLL